MNSAKMEQTMKLSVPATDEDKGDIAVFFTQHRELKKGPTILRWIKEGIKRDTK